MPRASDLKEALDSLLGGSAKERKGEERIKELKRQLFENPDEWESGAERALYQRDRTPRERALDRIERMRQDEAGEFDEIKKLSPIALSDRIDELIKKMNAPEEIFRNPEEYAEGGKIGRIIDAAKRFKSPDQRGLEKFHKEMIEEIRDKSKERQKLLNQTEFLYQPGDIVLGSTGHPLKLKAKTLMQDGRPGYYFENLGTGDESTLGEWGIKGKFDGPKEEYAEGGEVDNPHLRALRAGVEAIPEALDKTGFYDAGAWLENKIRGEGSVDPQATLDRDKRALSLGLTGLASQ